MKISRERVVEVMNKWIKIHEQSCKTRPAGFRGNFLFTNEARALNDAKNEIQQLEDET